MKCIHPELAASPRAATAAIGPPLLRCWGLLVCWSAGLLVVLPPMGRVEETAGGSPSGSCEFGRAPPRIVPVEADGD